MPDKVDRVNGDIEKAMKQLRESMRGIQIRRAGFKKHHTELTRAVANLSLTLVDAKPAINGTAKRKHR